MTDIDRPAPGFDAFTLLAAAEAREKTRPLPVGSGISSIDNQALDGGFRYGEITSIAGASGSGKTLLTFQAIASSLLGREKGEVALIDTTGSFSPLRLRNVVVSRILEQSLQPAYQQSGYVYERSLAGSTVSDQSVVEEATSLLDRVKVMRVFDFAGVVEAVSEIGQIWEKGDHNADGQLEAECQKGNKIIDDSETDDVSCDNDNGSNASSIARAENYDEQPEDKSCCISMVIIDTITNIASSMVQRNQTQGQAMLTSFMGSLHHLTTRRHICTLLVNMAVGLDSSSHLKYQRKTGNNASIFASVLGKPALGRIYKHHIDTSVFLSFIPETQEDAEIAYGGAHAAKWKKVSVCEVLSDRYGGREGQWACFEIVDEVRVKNLS